MPVDGLRQMRTMGGVLAHPGPLILRLSDVMRLDISSSRPTSSKLVAAWAIIIELIAKPLFTVSQEPPLRPCHEDNRSALLALELRDNGSMAEHPNERSTATNAIDDCGWDSR